MKRITTTALCGLILITTAMAETLKVDKSRSRIHVDGKSTAHDFTGTLKDYTTKVSGNVAQLEPTEFELGWKFSDLKTANNKRDKNMIEWLGGGTPKGSFQFIKSWKKEGKSYAQGKVTIHGVTKTITFPYTVKREGDWITIDGRARLDYRDFKLPIIRAVAVMTVNPSLTIRFHIVGTI